jgi:GntR family transcriptional regulator
LAQAQHAPARFAEPSAGLDAGSGIALYAQLAELFHYHIVSGKWPEGHQLDSFDVLAQRYNVARITVRLAVGLLVKQSLLRTQRGRGTFVLAPRGAANGAAGTDSLEIELLYNARASQLPAEFQTELGAFDAYREITKLHRLNGAAFAMVRIFVAESVFQRFPKHAITQDKLLRLTFKHAPRASEQMHQRMTIELADLLVSQHLGCALGSPIAKILRQTYGADRRLSYAGLSWYRGDAFEMDMTLPRDLVLENPPNLIAPGMRNQKL